MSNDPWTESQASIPAPMPPPPNAETERLWTTLERVLTESTREQRRARRWGIFFKTLTLGYIIGLSVWVFRNESVTPDFIGTPHTAVVPIDGLIAADEVTNAHDVILNLEEAFSAPNARGVMLEINSPGGSPVQSEYVYRALMRLKADYPGKPVHAVIGDIGASGAYYIAAAADSIHAAPASIVGSIGVVSSGFGFAGLMDKLGVDRRVITAGDSKAMLDPFSPESMEDRAHLQTILNQTHQQFIARVKEGRGDRLRSEDVFDGRIWNGETALGLGLIDSLAGPDEVARDLIGAAERVYYVADEPLWQQVTRQIGVGISVGLSQWLQAVGQPFTR